LAQLELMSSDKAGPVSLEAILRRVAEENRNGHLQMFYSIRSVAAHFRVPSATISRIYRRLSADRILRMIWGSKTLLEPRLFTGLTLGTKLTDRAEILDLLDLRRCKQVVA
jgi:DNA-binding transcriptional regulator YhcF (GntR family)